jgi:phage/plasmid-like protein (TIGR03299 family)
MNQLAYKGAKPWHGLGFEVPEGATGAEMLNIAGLNWQVETRSLGMPTTNGKAFTLALPDSYRVVVRQDNDTVFQVASKLWKPVQNQEIVDFFREYCEAGNATMETVGALKGGGIIWALARLNGASDTKIGNGKNGKGDEVRGYMILATAHDGSLPTIGVPTQTRVVCWNTMRAALHIGASGKAGKKQVNEFRMIHTAKFDERKREEARKTMGMAIEQIAAVNEVANDLSKARIDEEGRLQFVERLLLNKGDLLQTIVQEQQPASILDAAVNATVGMTREAREKRVGFVGRAILDAIVNSPGANLPSAKDTWWGALNGCTFYADHAAKTFSESNRVYNAWFGKNDTLKSDALNLAIEMTGIRAAAASASVN